MKKTLFLFFALSLFITSCTRIEPGFVGFKYNYTGDDKGKAQTSPAVGWTTYTPGFSRVVEFPTYMQHYEGEVTIFCKLGASLKCKVGYNYAVMPEKASDIYFAFKTDDLESITNGFLYNTLRNVMNSKSGSITLDSFITNVPAFTMDVDRILTDSFQHHGFKVSQFGIIGAPEIVDDNIRQSISNKIKAKQDAETAVAQLQTSIAEANKSIATAKGDSAVAVIRATGDAEAIKRKQSVLTSEYVEFVKWSRWDGKLPTTNLGSGTNYLYSNK